MVVELTKRRCRCRCKTGCVYFSDDFSSGVIGRRWRDDAGTWTVTAGKAATSSASAFLRCVKENPDADDEHVVKVTVSASASGDQIKVYTNWRSAANYWYAMVEFGATDSTLTLWENTGGGDVQRGGSSTLTGVAAGDDVLLTICFGAAAVYVNPVSSSGSRLWGIYYETTDLGDSWTGVGTGTLTGTATFDDFSLSRHGEVAGGCPTCLACGVCEDGTTPPSVDIVVPALFLGSDDVPTMRCTTAQANATLAGPFTLDAGAGSTSCSYFYQSAKDAICMDFAGNDWGFWYKVQNGSSWQWVTLTFLKNWDGVEFGDEQWRTSQVGVYTWQWDQPATPWDCGQDHTVDNLVGLYVPPGESQPARVDPDAVFEIEYEPN